MAIQLYFKNEKTGKKYKIVRFDKPNGVVVLKGEIAEFSEPYDKDRFAKLGYVLEKEATDA